MPRSLPSDPEIARWLDDMRAQRRSRYTVKHYGLVLSQFERWLRQELQIKAPASRVGESDLKQYQIWLSTQKRYAKSTLYISLKALQSFYRFLGRDVADGLKPPRRAQGLPKYLTEAEATRLLSACSDHARDQAAVSLLLYSGVRVGELCSLLVPDIDWTDGMIRVRSGKGDKDRLVVAPAKCLDAVRAWVQKRPPTGSDYLFPGRGARAPLSVLAVQRMVVRRARQAGLEKRVTPHVLRHTLATTLLRRGGDIRFIQKILGHASIATTQIYTHLDDAQLKRMYDAARPDF